ncbi:MAG: hypothetical protein ABJF01_01590 [bacterium]
MQNDDRTREELIEYDDDERRLFAELPREEVLTPGDVDRLVRRLRFEGFFRARVNAWRWGLAAAAAIVLFAAGTATGRFAERRNSLDALLARSDLSITDRVLLLQRAGTAYVQAAQSYASATTTIDSGAVEVASRVLMGAAHAVARNGLDAGLSARLTSALQPSVMTPVSAPRKPVIWY